jgi:heme exporter protein D
MSELLGLEAHAGFVLASYGLTLTTIGGLIAWVVFDYRAQTRDLAAAERRGLTRRSGGRPS